MGDREVRKTAPGAGRSITQLSAADDGATRPPTAQSPRRIRLPLAAGAALLVVALLAGVLATLAHNRATQGLTGPITVSGTATPTGTTTGTATRDLVAGAPSKGLTGVPVVAPSDPQVVYEYADNTPQIVLRRSNNGGATWQDLANPGGGFISAIELAVNPADARNVFLRLTLGYMQGEPSPCGRGSAYASTAPGVATTVQLGDRLPRSSGLDCTDVFVSQDGGTGWSLVRLPVAGSLFQTGVTFTYDATALQAQGSQLFGRVWQLDANGVQTGDIRIVRTGDEGLTWSAADDGLNGQGRHICAFSAVPQGATLFAVVSTAGCWDWNHGTRAVWRSDDAGAHWARSGGPPKVVAQPGATLIAASLGTANDASSTVLYAIPMVMAVMGPADIQVTADGGQTWTSAPTAGLPAGARLLLPAQTTLSDGALVVAFASRADAAQGSPTPPPPGNAHQQIVGAVTCYQWSVGTSAWQSLTPTVTFNGPLVANVYVSTNGQPAVTLSAPDDDTTNPTYTLVPFTPRTGAGG